jgi:hypothetical protein
MSPQRKDTHMSKKKYKKSKYQTKQTKFNVNYLVILLFVALGLLLLIVNNNFSFQQGHHGFLSSHGITLANNLSFKEHFLMFDFISINENNTTVYSAYNRFPLTSFLATKIAMLFAMGNLKFEILFARYLMLGFFMGSMIFAYLSLKIVFQNKAVALTTVLLSFSSFYMLYYSDMIFNDIPTLFGMFLTLHGIVVYQTDHTRYKQLIIKSLIGILLGWQVYTLLLLYIIYLFISFFVKGTQKNHLIKSYIINPFLLGLATLILGVFILGFQLWNESKMTKKPLSEISTISSMKKRTGADSEFTKRYKHILTPTNVISVQFDRVKNMLTPHSFTSKTKLEQWTYVIFLLILFMLILLFMRKELPLGFSGLTVFALSGLLWGFGMKGFTMFHDFQSIYYIGIPLLTYGTILYAIAKKLHSDIVLILLAFTLFIFAYSTITINNVKNNRATHTNVFTADMQTIQEILQPREKVCLDGELKSLCGGRHACAFYLHRHYLYRLKTINRCNYVVSQNKHYNQNLKTTNNQRLFLFSIQ